MIFIKFSLVVLVAAAIGTYFACPPLAALCGAIGMGMVSH
jgi:hypothetical protein